MVPIRRCSRGSTTSVRDVPIAFGFPGQSAAEAGSGAQPAKSATASTAQHLTRTQPVTSAISDNSVTKAHSQADHYMLRRECSLKCKNFTDVSGFVLAGLGRF